MYKSTIQQFILFVITTFIVIKTGKHMIELNDINSFFDFGMVMLFFIAFIGNSTQNLKSLDLRFSLLTLEVLPKTNV